MSWNCFKYWLHDLGYFVRMESSLGYRSRHLVVTSLICPIETNGRHLFSNSRRVWMLKKSPVNIKVRVTYILICDHFQSLSVLSFIFFNYFNIISANFWLEISLYLKKSLTGSCVFFVVHRALVNRLYGGLLFLTIYYELSRYLITIQIYSF